MAQITITIPDAVVERVLDAFAVTYGYEDNGETRAQFAKRQVQEFIRRTVRDREAAIASHEAHLAAVADVDADIALT